jgi:hypothetical protein
MTWLPKREKFRGRSIRGMRARDEINAHNGVEFINEHPKRLEAYAKQQRDINRRRQRARLRAEP